MPKKPDTSRKVVDAALGIAAASGWRDARMADIAAEAGLSLAELHALYPSKAAILDAFSAGIDGEVLAGTAPDLAAEPARDRLFDVMMRRFEALRPHRAALRGLACAARRDPLLALEGGCRLLRSMRWTLEAAGMGASGLAGKLRCKALAAIHLDVMRVWLADDSEDMGRTMAALDRRLKQADSTMARLCRLARPARRRGPSAETA